MLKDINKIREEVRISNRGSKIKGFIYSCENCKKEMFISVYRYLKATGYCHKCHFKNKIKNINNTGIQFCYSCEEFLDIKKFKKLNNKVNTKYKCNRCWNLFRLFKITGKQYKIILKKQNGVCAICDKFETSKGSNGKILPLSVDHNHKTGQIRGLLCAKCNKGIGLFNDNINILIKAIKYLEKLIK